MCGRFGIDAQKSTIEKQFRLKSVPKLTPQFNIPPSANISGVQKNEKTGENELRSYHWGYIPSWTKEKNMGLKLINARSETVREKPIFRSAFQKRRCIIPASFFYEWKRIEKEKQPYCFRLKNNDIFGFAGLSSEWTAPDGEIIESCTILTTEANKLMKPIHHRMPVILNSEYYDFWIDHSNSDFDALQKLLVPYDDSEMESYPVSKDVNSPRYNEPKCIEPIELPSALF